MAADANADRGGAPVDTPWELREWIDLPGGGRLERIGHLIGSGPTLQSYRVDFTLAQLGGLLTALDARALAAPAGAGVAETLHQPAIDSAKLAYDHANAPHWIGQRDVRLIVGAYLAHVADAAPAPAAAVEFRTAELHYDPERAYTLAELDPVVRAMEPGAPAAAGETGESEDDLRRTPEACAVWYSAAAGDAIRQGDQPRALAAVDRIMAAFGRALRRDKAARDASPGAGTDGATISKLANEFAGEVYGLLARNYSEAENDDIQEAAEEAARKLLPNILAAALRLAQPAAPADGAAGEFPAELAALSFAVRVLTAARSMLKAAEVDGIDLAFCRQRVEDARSQALAEVDGLRARIDATDRAAARVAERGEGV